MYKDTKLLGCQKQFYFLIRCKECRQNYVKSQQMDVDFSCEYIRFKVHEPEKVMSRICRQSCVQRSTLFSRTEFNQVWLGGNILAISRQKISYFNNSKFGVAIRRKHKITVSM